MIRDIRFLPLMLAAELKPDKQTVVISILDAASAGQRPKFCGFLDSLNLTFLDFCEEAGNAEPGTWPEEPTAEEHTTLSAIEGEQVPSLSHAIAIVQFVYKHHDSERPIRLAVHCFGGTSRSAAVAQWASDRFRAPIRHLTKFGTEDANPRIRRLLDKADAALRPTAS